MSNWYEDPFFSSPLDGSQLAASVGGDPSSVINSVVSVCQGPNNVEQTRRRVACPKTQRELQTEVRKIGSKSVSYERSLDHGKPNKPNETKLTNLRAADLPTFNSDWEKAARSLPKPENLNAGSPSPSGARFQTAQPTKPKSSKKDESSDSSSSSSAPKAKKSKADKTKTVAPSKPGPVGSDNVASHADELRGLALVNKERAKYKLPPLTWDQSLRDIVMPHSIRMMQKAVPLSHDGAQERFKQADPAERVGENVGYNINAADPVETMDASWIKSPHHHANMIGPFTHFGVCYALNDKGEWYGTQLYARRANPGHYHPTKVTGAEFDAIMKAINSNRKSPLKNVPALAEPLEKNVVDVIQRLKKPNMDGFQERAQGWMKQKVQKYSESACAVDGHVTQQEGQTEQQVKQEMLKKVTDNVVKAAKAKITDENFNQVGVCVFKDEYDYYAFALAFAKN